MTQFRKTFTLAFGLLTMMSLAQAQSMKSVNVAIDAQDLSAALIQLAQQTGCQFFAPQTSLQGIIARPVVGKLTVEQALQRILSGSGLTYGLAEGCTFYIGAPTVPVRPMPTAASEVLGASAATLSSVAESGGGTSNSAAEVSSAHTAASSRGADSGVHAPGWVDEIIVTAGKRSVPLQSLPASVQVLTAESLQQLGAREFSDYLGQVAGVSFTNMGTSGSKITMRGLATTNFSESQSTVGIYIDETPVTDAGGAPAAFIPAFNIKLVDIDRIEALKGPQGTLFGAGALGGALRIITKQPDSTRYAGSAELAGSFTEKGGANGEISLVGNAPLISDKLAIRASGYLVRNAGYIDDRHPLRNKDDLNDEDTSGGRVALQYTPNSNLKLTTTVLHQDMKRGGAPVESLGAGDLIQLRAADETFRDSVWQYNFLTEYGASFADIVWSTSYYDRVTEIPFDITNEAGFLFPGYPLQQNSNTTAREASTELRFVSNGAGPLQWLFGVYGFDQDRIYSQGIPDIPGASNPLFRSRQDAKFKELSAFGELSYAFTKKLKGTVGLRGFKNDINFKAMSDGFFNGGVTTIAGKGDDSDITPKFNVSYTTDSGDVLYASATRGYRRGGVNSVAPNGLCTDEILSAAGFPNGIPQTFSPDTVWNYETGARAGWADGRVRTDVAFYYVDWSDLPVPIALPCSVTFNVNAAKARTMGSEIAVRMQPTDYLNISATLTLTDATLQSNVPLIGAKRGDRAPTVPKVTSSVAAALRFPIGVFQGFVNVDANYVGSSLNNYNSGVASELHSYTIGNMRAGIRRDHWSVEMFVRNLLDERAELSRFDQAFAVFIVRNQPRTVGLQARWEW